MEEYDDEDEEEEEEKEDKVNVEEEVLMSIRALVPQAALMKYQTMRGGRVVLQDITKPTTTEWGTPLQALVTVLDLEKKVSREQMELVIQSPE